MAIDAGAALGVGCGATEGEGATVGKGVAVAVGEGVSVGVGVAVAVAVGVGVGLAPGAMVNVTATVSGGPDSSFDTDVDSGGMSPRAQQPRVSNDGDSSVLSRGPVLTTKPGEARSHPASSETLRIMRPEPRFHAVSVASGWLCSCARDLQLDRAGGNPDASGNSRSCRRWRRC